MAGADGEADDGAAGDQSVDTGGNRCPRCAGHRCKRGDGNPGVMAKCTQKFGVEIVHADHFVKSGLSICAIIVHF